MDRSPAAADLQLAVEQPLSAVALGDVEIIRKLLDRGFPIDTKDDKGKSLLHWAAWGGNMTAVSFLIKRGCDVDSVDVRGLTPLHYAAQKGQTKAVQELIRYNASKSVVAGELGVPLHQAAFEGYVDTVKAMLEEECPIDAVDTDGATVLHWAVEGGKVEIVNELVGKGCDVNAVKANGCTPLHYAAAYGRRKLIDCLIKLGAVTSAISATYGTALHLAIANGNMDIAKRLLKDKVGKHEYTEADNIIGACNAYGQTPVMWAFLVGQVEVVKLLISKDVTISDRDTHSLSSFELCLVGGHASKLTQFCEACSIGNRNVGLRDALATLIAKGLVNAHKVLCLNAVSGECVFLDDQFSELVAFADCLLPAAMKGIKNFFFESESFIAQLNMPDGEALNPLQIALISVKCFKMGFARLHAGKLVTGNHSSFITKLLSHPVLKEAVHKNFPNGLSTLDIAQQFELHDIAALIKDVGGRPGVWSKLPQSVFMSHRSKLFQFYPLLKNLCDVNHGGHEAVKEVVIALLGGQTVDTAAHVANARQMVKEQVLGQRPDLVDIVMHVLPHIQVRHWKRVGLVLHLEKNTIDDFQQKSQDNDDRYLETLSYWLEHGSSVTWKTLLDVLGHFETKHTIDELTDKIVSELESTHQVSVQRRALTEMLCSDAVLPSCLLIVFELSPPPPLRR